MVAEVGIFLAALRNFNRAACIWFECDLTLKHSFGCILADLLGIVDSWDIDALVWCTAAQL